MKDDSMEFDWDDPNLEHLRRHNVESAEAEQALSGEPLDIELQIEEESDGEERLLQLGATEAGRILQLVTTWRGEKVRVISAWDAPRQLKLYYLTEMKRRYGQTEDSEV